MHFIRSIRSSRRSLIVGLAFVLSAQTLAAQGQGTVEIGGDAGLDISIFPGDVPTMTSVNLPLQRVRVGFWLSNEMSVEPGVGFDWLEVENRTFTEFRLDGSVVYHFGTVGAARPYLRGTGVFDLLRFSDPDPETFTQFGAGGGVGAKLPITGNLSFRLDGGVTRFFENDDFVASTAINALVGLSVFVN